MRGTVLRRSGFALDAGLNLSRNGSEIKDLGGPAFIGTGNIRQQVGYPVGSYWDYRVVNVGSRTYWTPVRDLTIGVEVNWTNHHVSHGDNVVYNQPVISGFKPNAAYEVRDQNVFSGIFSVRRFF